LCGLVESFVSLSLLHLGIDCICSSALEVRLSLAYLRELARHLITELLEQMNRPIDVNRKEALNKNVQFLESRKLFCSMSKYWLLIKTVPSQIGTHLLACIDWI
jgi:hypothetical protein